MPSVCVCRLYTGGGDFVRYSSTQHYQKCTVCNASVYSNHTVDGWTVTSGWYGNQHQGACKDCGYSVSSSCSYSGAYITENGQHWQLCSVCKQPGTKTNCSSWSGASSNNDGTHSITCSTCSVANTVACSYGSYQSNGSSGHHKYCSTCRTYSATEPHNDVEYEYYGNERHKKVCADCGYSLGYEDCSFGSYSDLGTQHSRTCSVCKETVTENHSYDYNTKKCKCGAEKHEHSWKLTASGNKITASCTGTTGTCEYNKNGGSLTITASNADYDGNAKQATVTNTLNTGSYNDDRYTVSYYKKNASGSYVPIYSAPTDAGEYRATVYSSLDSTAVASVEYRINKVTKNVTATGYEGTYDGNKHGITVNAPAGLTVEYSENGTYYSAYNVPAYTDAGTYTVYYRVTGNENYEITGGTGSATVKINPVELSVTATGYEGTYDGEYHGITVDAGGLKVTYDGYKTSSTTYKDSGTYTVTYEVENNSNYNITNRTGSATVKINPVELTVTAEGYTGTYDGQKHTIQVKGLEGTGLSVRYGTAANSCYNSYPNEYSDAGEYTVYYEVSGNGIGNYDITGATGSATVKINPVELTVTAEGYTGTYDGNKHGITVNAPAGLTVEYSENGTHYSAYNVPAYTDAGTYTVYYKVTGDKNHVVTNGTGSAVVQINKADLQTAVTAQNYEGVYDGKAHGITVNAPDGVTVQYSKDGENWNTYDANRFTDVCEETTVYYKAKVASYDEKNYAATEATGSATVKITALDLATVVTAENTAFTYNRYNYTNEPSYATHSIKVTVDKSKIPSYDSVTVEYSTDGESWSTTNPSFTDAGEYTVQYRAYVRGAYSSGSYAENKNYVKTEGTRAVTIHKADLPITELVGYEGPYDGSTHYGFGYQYTTSYGSYFTTYYYNYLHKELDYSFSWTDETGAARTLTVKAGESPALTDFPGYTKQNVTGLSGSEPGNQVTVTISSDNYNEKTFTYNVKIGPGGAYSDSNTVPYDGSEHYIKNYIAGRLYAGFGEVYNFGSIKIEYRVEGSDTWLPASQEPGQTNVGSLVVEWKVTMDSDQNGVFGEESNSFGSSEVFTGKDTVTVTPIGLTATANDKTITYGEAPANNGVTITGTYVGSDTEAVVDKSGLGYDHEYAQYGSVGTYDITPRGLSATNYTFTYVPGTLTVEQKPVTILIDDGVATASDELQAPQLKVDPDDLVNGDTCMIEEVEYYSGGTKLNAAPTTAGTYTAKVTKLSNGNYKPANDVEFTLVAPDVTAPTGNIKVATNNWNSFQTSVTFDIYFKEGKAVTITAADEEGGSGLKSIEYYVSTTAKSLADVAAMADSAWSSYDGAFTIIPNQKVVVYAKFTDNAGNVTYISSNGLIFDGTAPEVDGVKNGKKYSKDVEITVTDKYLDKVTVDGKEIELDEDGACTIKYDSKKHTVIATDKAGNETKVIFTMGKTAAVEDDNPASGDTFNMVFWGFVMLASAAALAVVITGKRKVSGSKRK